MLAGLVAVDDIPDATYTAWIDAAEAEFQRMTGVVVVAAAATDKTFRLFDPVGVLDLGGYCHGDVTITVDADDLETDYFAMMPEGGPYSYIRFNGRVDGTVVVNAKHGYADECPKDLKEALIGYCLAKLSMSLSTGGAFVGSLVSEKLGEVSYTYGESDSHRQRVSWVSQWVDQISQWRGVAVA